MSEEIRCPDCHSPLGGMAGGTCQNASCGRLLPTSLFQAGGGRPPLRIALAGGPIAARRSFLDGLVRVLQNLGRALPGAYVRWHDPTTHEMIRQIGHEPASVRSLREPPPARALLFSVHGLKDGEDSGVILSIAGHEAGGHADLGKTLRAVDALWYLASLDPPDPRIPDVPRDDLQLLRAALRAWESGPEPPHVIVIHTASRPLALAEEWKDVLACDPFASLLSDDTPTPVNRSFSLTRHAEDLDVISERLGSWIETERPGGSLLTSIARGLGFGLDFGLTALPASLAARRRVLDPLLQTLVRRDGGPTRATVTEPEGFALVLDAGPGAQAVYDGGLAGALALRLAKEGATACYFLGQSRAVSPPGKSPPNTPPERPLPRLVGPILEALPGEIHVIILTAGVILDAADFVGSAWGSRLVVVPCGDQPDTGWPASVPRELMADPTFLVGLLTGAPRA